MAERERSQTAGSHAVGRVLVYSLLVLFALYYLMPLFVMLTTSLKTLDEIRAGNLLSLPRAASPSRPGPRPGAAPAPASTARA